MVVLTCFNKEHHALLGQPPVQTDRNIHKLSLIFRRQGKTRISAIIGRHLLRYIWNVSTDIHSTYIHIYIPYASKGCFCYSRSHLAYNRIERIYTLWDSIQYMHCDSPITEHYYTTWGFQQSISGSLGPQMATVPV
jgi:hypothetical protein